jgi:hypothetical protein
MDQFLMEGRRPGRSAARHRGLLLAAIALAVTTSASLAETKPATDEAFRPLCTPGIVGGKNLDSALGLYELGAGLLGADLVDAEGAKNCLKGTVANLSLNVDGVQLNLTGGVQYQGIFGPQRRIIANTSSPALCESYYAGADLFALQLSNANNEAQGPSGLLGGVLSAAWNPGTGAFAPNLARAQHAPWISCYDATLANALIPAPSPDALFSASFETRADLRVQYLDAQGGPIDSMVQTIGANSTYKVRITNVGESAAQNVRVREFAPKVGGLLTPNMNLVGCVRDADAGSCAAPDGTLRHDIASLPAGGSVSYTLTRKVNGTTDIAATSGALTSVAAFVDPNAVGERNKFDNTRHLRIGLMTNGAPVATPQPGLVTNEDTSRAIVLAGTDVENSPLTFAVNQPAASVGSVTVDGVGGPNVTFVPAPDFNGAASFTFTVNDGSVTSAPATVSISVTPVNDAPRIAQQLADRTVPENAVLFIETAAGFADPEGTALTFSATGLPPGIQFAPNGTVIGTLGLNTAGKYTITVTATEVAATALSVSQGFILNISNTNQNPIVTAITDQDSDEGEAISFNVAGSFSDPDTTDTLTFSLGGGTLPPGLSISAIGVISGTISQTAANGSPYSVTVLADDGNDGQITDTFTWTVSPVNVAPITVGTLDDVVGEVGVPMEILGTTIKAGFADPDGNTLTFSASGVPSGLIFFPGSANISGVPATGTQGNHVVTITATDPGGLTATQAFTIAID